MKEVRNEKLFEGQLLLDMVYSQADTTSVLFSTGTIRYYSDNDSILLAGNVGKMDQYGNLLWLKSYSVIDSVHSAHDIQSISPIVDGNYLISGYSAFCKAIPRPYDRIHSFLIKIDEDGNILFVDTTNKVKFTSRNLVDQIQVYPNPTIDQIVINQQEIQYVTYQVINTHGNIVKTLPLLSPQQSVV